MEKIMKAIEAQVSTLSDYSRRLVVIREHIDGATPESPTAEAKTATPGVLGSAIDLLEAGDERLAQVANEISSIERCFGISPQPREKK
jgi:hypothetical protein